MLDIPPITSRAVALVEIAFAGANCLHINDADARDSGNGCEPAAAGADCPPWGADAARTSARPEHGSELPRSTDLGLGRTIGCCCSELDGVGA